MKKIWTRLRRTAVYVCAFLGLLMLAATFTPAVAWYARRLAGPWADPKGETMIVLGGASIRDFPDQNTVFRCMYAVMAYREGGFKKIVVTGRGVSRGMRNFLVAGGVPEDAVVVEDAATSTRENALNAARLLAGDRSSKVLLTSDYHMYRAVRAFRKAGLDVAPRPIPDAIKRAGNRMKRWQAFTEEAGESVKIVYYRWRGWI